MRADLQRNVGAHVERLDALDRRRLLAKDRGDEEAQANGQLLVRVGQRYELVRRHVAALDEGLDEGALVRPPCDAIARRNAAQELLEGLEDLRLLLVVLGVLQQLEELLGREELELLLVALLAAVRQDGGDQSRRDAFELVDLGPLLCALLHSFGLLFITHTRESERERESQRDSVLLLDGEARAITYQRSDLGRSRPDDGLHGIVEDLDQLDLDRTMLA